MKTDPFKPDEIISAFSLLVNKRDEESLLAAVWITLSASGLFPPNTVGQPGFIITAFSEEISEIVFHR